MRTPNRDFRTSRRLLPDEVFLLSTGKRPGPTDLIPQSVWHGIMHLPDDVAITTSNHHGTEFAALYKLWGDWFKAIGEEQDALFGTMLDAADWFQSSTFDCLHGYYRSALSNLRSALELVAIGALGNLAPTDVAYLKWKDSHDGSSLTFPTCYRRLQGVADIRVKNLLAGQRGWIEAFYYKLCGYAHSRPDSSDGAMWRSNGPIYVGGVVSDVFRLQVSTYAISYILATIGRSNLILPRESGFLFEKSSVPWCVESAITYRAICDILRQ